MYSYHEHKEGSNKNTQGLNPIHFRVKDFVERLSCYLFYVKSVNFQSKIIFII